MDLPTFENDAVRIGMSTGPWSTWPAGEPSLGALGAAIDNAVGLSVLRARPPGHGSVTAELSVDVLRPDGLRSGRLVTVGRLIHIDSRGGYARCEVLDGAHAAVVVGTARFQFVVSPGSPAARPEPASRRPRAASGEGPPARCHDVADLLGASVEPGPRLARVVIEDPSRLYNSSRTVHGGILFCVSELAASAITPSDEGSASRTTSVRMNFLRPGSLDDALVVTAEVIHHGRTTTVCRVTAGNLAGRTYTVATVTRLASGGAAAH
ncbi:PaaI family thioesterase [Frankia sp. CNm7]|uniref:PaaI family thioesterase n=1 Tax=Frankia nepalensis TaxID=1836974 RepID=A0A937RGI1_9ACTN|nr:PaaI family thioesterase [Frankia nepalensis]MBL7500299.1 PaaI family thioesterase [Frankia nepalensis]MBL7512000.1 PaaI family thioesterase [Frankia nepalensis]MBL7521193.1 PaaI family thioesterase [Frankia nepalensis]MBL7631758.1 PaaI family thioesterase [Frankia nepalensis]